MKLFRDELIYPPHKLRDIENKNGVRWNVGLLKTLLITKHFNKLGK